MAVFRIDQVTPGVGTAGVSRHDLVPGEVITLTATAPSGGGVVHTWEILDKAGSAAVLSATTGTSVTIGTSGAVTQPCAFKIKLSSNDAGNVTTQVLLASVRTASAGLRIPLFGEVAAVDGTLTTNDSGTSTDNAVYVDRAGTGATEQNWRGWAEWAYEITLAAEAGGGGGGGPVSLQDAYDTDDEIEVADGMPVSIESSGPDQPQLVLLNSDDETEANIYSGADSPDGVISASEGSLYVRIDGTNSQLWQNVSSTSGTAWINLGAKNFSFGTVTDEQTVPAGQIMLYTFLEVIDDGDLVLDGSAVDVSPDDGNDLVVKLTPVASTARTGLDVYSTAEVDALLVVGESLTGTTDDTSVALGIGTLPALTTGVDNIAIGDGALTYVADGTRNVAVGTSAGPGISQPYAYDLVAIGHEAIANAGCVAVGASARAEGGVAVGYAATTSGSGVSIGLSAGEHLAGGANTFCGSEAGKGITPGGLGTLNVAVGYNAQKEVQNGDDNVSVGSSSLFTIGDGNKNVAIGTAALYFALAVDDNVAIGYNALYNNLVAANTAVGARALDNNSTGLRNTAVGFDALGANSIEADNTALGYRALAVSTDGPHNTAVGANALVANSLGFQNTAVGSAALSGNTEGNLNTAVGYNALLACVEGSTNTAVGSNALGGAAFTTSGSTAVGASALYLNTVAGSTAVGAGALDANTSGAGNTAVGTDALGANSTAAGSTAVGFNALIVSTGANNTAVGSSAGVLATGANNTFLGKSAGATTTTGTDNIVIGYNESTSAAGASDELNLGSVLKSNNRTRGQIELKHTNTAGGTTGTQTIDKPSGTVNFAGGVTTLTVNNACVTSTSLIFVTLRTNDGTAVLSNKIVPGSGSFVITMTVAPTGETSVGFLVIN